MIGFASIRMGVTRERVAFWLAAGSGLVLADGTYRLDKPSGFGSRPGPAPAPVPEKLAREAIAAGAPLRVVGDLFGRSA
ncbi:hypothetical protein [uncultured Methylobacterium sp.]|uniref:hypothetical protein n=1 Tax=uncultured Methylobacterium sp. TaxID=157278 RepID=UPI0035CA7093